MTFFCFQGMKFVGRPEEEQIRLTASTGASKTLARGIPDRRSDWAQVSQF
jgi:hypothetical protein